MPKADAVKQYGGERSTADRLWAELGWWFPNSIAITSGVAVVGWYWSIRYYDAYYTAFALDPQRVGISRTDMLTNLLPMGVVVIILLIFIRAFWIVVSRDGSHDRKRVRADRRKSGLPAKETLVGLSLVAMVIGLSWLTLQSGNWWSEAGKHDARRVITSPYNVIHLSQGQTIFKTTASVSELRWVGPRESDIFAHMPTADTKDPHTLARVIARTGESTIYLDLYSCDVHIEPTVDLSASYGLTTYGVQDTLQFKLPTKPCASTIK